MKPPLVRLASVVFLFFRLIRIHVFALPLADSTNFNALQFLNGFFTSTRNSELYTDTNTPLLQYLVKRASDAGVHINTIFWIEIAVIAVLVLLSGIFAGLTLGYMSLDMTQLHVLSTSGTPKQKMYASRIRPIRQNGHLLLVTLLLVNVIINETLPIIADAALGGGVIAVVVSTVLIVVFSEIVPQSVCSRYGLAVGAFFAWPVRILIYIMFFISWPIAKLLDKILGPHHGIIYRRAELKEFINLHSSKLTHGGDLNIDTVTIMRGAIDLQEKTVRDAMTPIDQVFMLDVEAVLDRTTLEQIVRTGHSRVPVYEWTEVAIKPVHDPDQGPELQSKSQLLEVTTSLSNEDSDPSAPIENATEENQTKTNSKNRFKKIIGVLLVKNLILLDPDDNIPVREVGINSLPSVKEWMPLFDILNTFQEGRSHMAIVVPSERPKSKSKSNDDDTSIHSDHSTSHTSSSAKRRRSRSRRSNSYSSQKTTETPSSSMQLEAIKEMVSDDMFVDPEELIVHGHNYEPIGIITLEDVLEELIQEEIYDETDRRMGLAIPLGQGNKVILASPPNKNINIKEQLQLGGQQRSLSLPVKESPALLSLAVQMQRSIIQSDNMLEVERETARRRSRSESPNAGIRQGRGRGRGRLTDFRLPLVGKKFGQGHKVKDKNFNEIAEQSPNISSGLDVITGSPEMETRVLEREEPIQKQVRIADAEDVQSEVTSIGTGTPLNEAGTTHPSAIKSISQKGQAIKFNPTSVTDGSDASVAAIIPELIPVEGNSSPMIRPRAISRNRFKAPQMDPPALIKVKREGMSDSSSPSRMSTNRESSTPTPTPETPAESDKVDK